MQDNENEIRSLDQLLDKKQKLINLRKNILEKKYNINTTGPVETNRSDSYSVTSYLNEQPSISPPPFSPLTPLIPMTTSNDNKPQGQTDPGTVLSEIQHNFITRPRSLTPIDNKTPSSSSPLRSMTPETQQLFNILVSEQETIIENSDISNLNHEDIVNDYDSDDSIRDPNYVIHDKVVIDESSTSCSTLDINERNEASKNNFTTTEGQHNNIGVTSTNAALKEVVPLTTEYEETNINIIGCDVGTSRLKRGRKRINPQLRSERKHNKYNNLEYTTTKNKIVKPKEFIDYRCTCLKNCASLISVDKRKEEFDKFVKLGSHNSQLLYIISCVKEYNKKRSYTMTNVPVVKKKPKQFSRVYSINGVQVCRDMFLKTFQVTTQRVTTSLRKHRTGEPIIDGRGINRGGQNKLSDEDHKFIIDTINKLPKYESHYRRENNNNTLYLQPGMTLNKIYNIYRQEYAQEYGEERKCASFGAIKKIFYSHFNLKCKKLKKDTCNKCDLLSMKIQCAKTQEEKDKFKAEKGHHLETAEKLRSQMNHDFREAQISPTVECLTFDLEKTLPLPRIPTNLAFYKRQLWLYNSGVHSASNDIGHCYVWVEGDAGRGAQEVGSCLLKYIELKLSPSVEHLILWSDCCGGQNRNIKIVLMLKALLSSHQTLKTISFRFLESGHTFLPNDTDFSKIETALKHHQSLYIPEEYIDIFKNCKKKKPLQVYRMQKTDFLSTEKIEKNIINRKKFTDKSKVNWLNTKEIKIEKNKLFYIFMRSNFEEDFKELLIEKKNKGEVRQIKKSDLNLLWPNGKPIAPAKLTDLQSMYNYIPQNCLQFYQNLKSSDDIIDDFDGFGGEPDFDVQDVDNIN